MLAALLALAASISWGSSDFIAGVRARQLSTWSVLTISQPAAMVGALIAVLIDWQAPLDPLHTLAPAVGGIAGAIAIVAYYRAFTIGAMSIVAPIGASGALVPVLFGLARGERPGLIQYVGIALAVSGIVLLSRAQSHDGDRASLASVAYAIIAALGFGGMLIGFDLSGAEDPYWTVLDARITSALTIGIYLLLCRPSIKAPLRMLPSMAMVGLLLASANMLFTAAASLGYLSVVGVLGSIGPVVTVALARGILRERLTIPQLSGAATVIIGVILLSV